MKFTFLMNEENHKKKEKKKSLEGKVSFAENTSKYPVLLL